jgi:hypothetical protein
MASGKVAKASSLDESQKNGNCRGVLHLQSNIVDLVRGQGFVSVDADGILLDFDYHLIRIGHPIVENSRKVFLVTDQSKFGRQAMVCLCIIRELHALLMDRILPPAMCKMLAAADGRLNLAKEPSPSDLEPASGKAPKRNSSRPDRDVLPRH